MVANIIGAGIFTTTGFQAADLGHPGWIYLLWTLGGVLALAGALCYAELGAAMPEAGAEYVYLRETYGPALGFMSAFVSLIAGFSAPIAAATKSLVRYARPFVPALGEEGARLGPLLLEDLAAIVVVWLLIAVHLRGRKGGFGFNDVMTLLKVVGITGIIVAAFAFGRGELERIFEVSPRFAQVVEGKALLPAMATSLVFVMFCYSGWNASAYVASEMRDPQRDLPRSLLLGTALVFVLYLGLNVVYFMGAGVDGLAGHVEVGQVAARELFGLDRRRGRHRHPLRLDRGFGLRDDHRRTAGLLRVRPRLRRRSRGWRTPTRPPARRRGRCCCRAWSLRRSSCRAASIRSSSTPASRSRCSRVSRCRA